MTSRCHLPIYSQRLSRFQTVLDQIDTREQFKEAYSWVSLINFLLELGFEVDEITLARNGVKYEVFLDDVSLFSGTANQLYEWIWDQADELIQRGHRLFQN